MLNLINMATLKSSSVFLSLLLLFLVSCGTSESTEATADETSEEMDATGPVHNALSPEEAAAGWELLFDGENTDQWKGYNHETFPTQGWRVQDGEIQVLHSGTEEDGFGGDIITKDSFTDFILSVDFAITDTSNSGIFYLVQEMEDTPIWHNAPEFQLLDDETYKVIYEGLTDAQLSGANYDMHPQEVNYSNPIGEWNTARIEKNGNFVKHFLNDSLVVEYELYSDDWTERYANSKFSEYPGYARATTAPIGLQDHGHLCRFRNIKIKRL